jgi:hypothetical protein
MDSDSVSQVTKEQAARELAAKEEAKAKAREKAKAKAGNDCVRDLTCCSANEK